ncbi:ribosomal protein L13 [Perkinsus sp. BL_2016]|nr:ribosomal protein L13 [Perkinsus sp. BL_2016]
MVSHNNILPNAHYSKGYLRHIKTWFNQPARHQRRRLARQAKAAAVFPRPTAGLLRPAVRPPTQRYNYKVRLGRGFTLDELKAAGISVHVARSIGVAVDSRRRNKSEEAKALNVERLLAFKSKLVVFPRGSKVKKGDTAKSELKNVAQNTLREIIPLPKAQAKLVARPISKAERSASVFATLRKVRVDKKLFGKRQKKAAEKKDE